MATLNNLKPDYENARLTFDADSIDYIVYKQIQCSPKVLLGESESNEKLLKFCAKLIMRNCTNGCSECTFLEKDGGCPYHDVETDECILERRPDDWEFEDYGEVISG